MAPQKVAQFKIHSQRIADGGIYLPFLHLIRLLLGVSYAETRDKVRTCIFVSESVSDSLFLGVSVEESTK